MREVTNLVPAGAAIVLATAACADGTGDLELENDAAVVMVFAPREFEE